MSYTVSWLPSAEQDLADTWLNAPDRDAVASAADAIDRQLQRDPLSVGESRSGAVRIVFLSPLVALFRVDQANRTVYVLRVRHSARP